MPYKERTVERLYWSIGEVAEHRMAREHHLILRPLAEIRRHIR